jgi:hypothetical protein
MNLAEWRGSQECRQSPWIKHRQQCSATAALGWCERSDKIWGIVDGGNSFVDAPRIPLVCFRTGDDPAFVYIEWD